MNHTETPHPTFPQAVRFWLKLGLISFGGPAGQISIMHRELVDTKHWVSEKQFLDGLNFCMLLPGPEAQQLATYLGWRLHGVRGGIAAGSLFVLPSAFLLFALSWIYMAGGEIPWLAAIFHGLLAAVIAVVAEAVLRIGKKSLRSPALWVLAGLSFVAIHFFHVSFVLIVLGAGLIGIWGHRAHPKQFPAAPGKGADRKTLPPMKAVTWRRNLAVLSVGLILWWGPILALAGWLGWHSTPAQQGLFFSKAALVTIGGAYAVLPYVAQQAVDIHAWLTPAQMMNGLALAETTPGPLIMVLQFVGFAGGWQHPGAFSPLVGATIGSLITTWATFLPCFIFIFLGGPYIDRIGTMPRISAGLTAVTAAVVGVILNLGVQFADHAVRTESGTDWFVVALAACAFVALKKFRIGLIPVIACCGLAGLLFWVV